MKDSQKLPTLNMTKLTKLGAQVFTQNTYSKTHATSFFGKHHIKICKDKLSTLIYCLLYLCIQYWSATSSFLSLYLEMLSIEFTQYVDLENAFKGLTLFLT